MTTYTEGYDVTENKLRQSSPVPYPWRRFWARHVDTSIYGTIWLAFALFVLRSNSKNDLADNLISLAVSLVLMLVIEPILLCKFGTTPGKWLFGLKVSDTNGTLLNYEQALDRTFGVLKSGMGFGIPFYNIYRNYKCYQLCNDSDLCDWEIGYNYEIKDDKGWRFAAFLLIFLLGIGIDIVLMAFAMLPVNRGAISAEEFYENYNELMDFHDARYGYKLDINGEWVKYDGESNVITYIHYELPTFEAVEENGEVVEVIMTAETYDSGWVTGYNKEVYFAYMSFVGAQKGVNIFRLSDQSVVKHLRIVSEDYSFEMAGVLVTNEVEYDGYSDTGSILISEEDQKQHYKQVFRMRKRQ